MEAIVVSAHDGPESLQLAETVDPEPGPGQVLIDVHAAGINFIDVYHRSGLYPTTTPFVPGLEGCGTITALGADATGFSVGDRVAWGQVPGSYATKVVADTSAIVPVPDGVSDEVAAAVMLQGMTAHYLTHSVHGILPGEFVLVHAAAGGVGLLLTQMARRLGGRVLATVSTAEKAELAREAGAEAVFGYGDFAERVAEVTEGEGVAVAYDGVGATTVDGSLGCLRPRGTLALFGQSSGPVPPIDPQRLAQGGSLFLTRPTLAHYVADPAEFAARGSDIFGWLAANELSVHIGGRYRLDEAVTAHADLEARRSTGKLLLLTH